ncbi:MAG: hypothetical protein U0132_05235 [Gemmatimonadaceae bacterium]
MRVILPRGTSVANQAQRVPAFLAIAGVAALCACWGTGGDGAPRAADAAPDSAVQAQAPKQTVVPPPLEDLDPLADTIAGRLVFAPSTQTDFVAAVRKGRLLMDVGRVDDNVTKTPERLAAFRRAVAARTPFDSGSSVRLKGPWGAGDAQIAGFDSYAGRIVGVLRAGPGIDSSIQASDSAVVLAERAGTGADPNESSCDRAWNDALRARAVAVRDSLERVLRTGEQPVYPRLIKSLHTRRSMLRGCFPDANVMVAVSLYGGDYEWVREKVVLLTMAGSVRSVPVKDLRLRAHDFLDAFDADGNGVDDVGGRGYTTRGGAHVVLRWVENRLERVTAGFAWER